MNVASNDYAGNDHIALAEDLRLVTSLGWRILPLTVIVAAYLGGTHVLPERTLAITFDDGPDFDFSDLPHPTWGVQRSMLGILQDFRRERLGLHAPPHATSFVITSPEARQILDRTCMIGQGWRNDCWWPEAIASGLMHIASHSWDHNHASLPVVRQREQRKGSFLAIDNAADADAQIGDSVRYIDRVAPNPGNRLFAYPYGEAADYLRREYFANTARNPGIDAAFGCQGGVLTTGSDRWFLPRNTCGDHWKSPGELERLLWDATP